MSNGVLSSVDQRTKLVGENRLELLMFQLGSRHIFAMNVFKISIRNLFKKPWSTFLTLTMLCIGVALASLLVQLSV